MANKTSVEDLLIQFFGTELISTTATSTTPNPNIITIPEVWNESNINKSKNIELQIDGESSSFVAPSDETLNKEFNINFDNCDVKDFENLFRVKQSTVLDLLKEINSTESNQVDTYLLVCLWVLGNTKSFIEIAELLETTQEQIHEICEVYFMKILSISSKYIYWPGNTEIIGIEKGFFHKYHFPGVVGVIGNLHVAVNVDENNTDAEKYFNKNAKHHTIVVQAVCDNNYLFRDLLAGCPGSNSTETILKESSLYKILTDENNLLTKTKKHLLGGTEHPQLETLLTPYKEQRKLSDRELKFNTLHGSVMFIVEKTFRMIENRFPRIRSLDSTSPKFATLAVAAICTLHNFCRLRNDSTCC